VAAVQPADRALSGVAYPSTLIRPIVTTSAALGIAWKPTARSKIVVRAGYGSITLRTNTTSSNRTSRGRLPLPLPIHHHQQRESVDTGARIDRGTRGKNITNTTAWP